MHHPLSQNWHIIATWLISLASIALVLLRPKSWPEAVWALAGAGLLIVTGLIPVSGALRGIAKGTDVYLFLTGMMIVSELARREGVFAWIAGHAVRAARGSPSRLFVLIYGVGILVTVFLSNDATAVVLTPAVLAAVAAAEADPLPYLLICAFIANAASFVLPISNPANLVVYDGDLPPLLSWFLIFGLASAASIVVTFMLLRALASKRLAGAMQTSVPEQPLSFPGKLALYGIGFLAVVLMTASALHSDLGAPACVAGLVVAAILSTSDRGVWKDIVTGVPWSVLLLVAGLFVIVEALNGAGALRRLADVLTTIDRWPLAAAALASGFSIAVVSNLVNNLPSGLIAAAALHSAHIGGFVRSAVLVGVDLGPNLSVTGSLATILWLIALRRDGLNVTFWDFLKWGAVVMPPALILAILALLYHPD